MPFCRRDDVSMRFIMTLRIFVAGPYVVLLAPEKWDSGEVVKMAHLNSIEQSSPNSVYTDGVLTVR